MTNQDVVTDFRPTHVVPQEGLPAWEAPDVSRPTAALDAFLPVQLLTRRGEWGEILCANGWSAWVDGRLLVAVPQPPPTAGQPLTRTEDPRPLLARTADALDRYRRAADELGSGRVDAEAFRRGTRGLRAGMVLDGESVWLYDDAAGRWMYGDGARLTTYAVAAGPGAQATPDPEGGASDRDPGGVVDAADPVDVPPATTGHDPTRVADAPEEGER
ncbi:MULTISPECIES: hypothetical protein [unclassified Streptomyces]|uniref:hypothetical protein n=1 Tax=unclassified Streptomyces TaxID=2593676 RepID=UPI001BE84324|nr:MULTISPECIES: hypothetical protein [unclassified Streptomyces]MBT2405370.1 hypothetical protein [Streptomyces sp. ISL-21]MBT2454127.1 hypothetical protein [Streptomyces sp. ISL-86]MBT2612221.1 hypothetical protein [Streptomyces sp. ISL-87]